MAKCSIELHVFSTLWIQKVGTYLDKRLSHSAYGSRLRHSAFGGPNTLGSGSFRNYYTPYKAWRDDGIAAIREALAEGREVVALTADATSFYHGLNADFLTRPAYLRRVLGANLDSEQRKINELFVAALQAWASQFSARDWPAQGLPVGLPASAVVANLALAELDAIAEQLRPRYYGRYVDDILLVLDDDGTLLSQDDIWERLVQRSGGLLRIVDERASDSRAKRSVTFAPDYLEGSVVSFENDKNKSFHLANMSGQAMIDSIVAAIQRRTSEWRALPTVPSDAEAINTQMALATRADGSDAATLRDTDYVSIRRLTLSLKLRDFEAYERNLAHDSWEDERRAFVGAVCEYVLAPPAIFELAAYVPRVVKLAAACRDVEALGLLFSAISHLPTTLAETCVGTVAHYSPVEPSPGVFQSWAEHLVGSSIEMLAAAWPGDISRDELEGLLAPFRAQETRVQMPGVRQLQRDHDRLMSRDLAHRPYRWPALGLPTAPGRERIPEPLRIDEGIRLEAVVEVGLDALVQSLPDDVQGRSFGDIRGSEVAGLVFATRPPSPLELYLALRGDADEHGVPPRDLINLILQAVRGYARSQDLPRFRRARGGDAATIDIPFARAGCTRRLAMTMFAADKADAVDAAKGTPNLTASRFLRLSRGLDWLRYQTEGADYLLLPELALPPHWFTHFALQFRRHSGPNLIAGIEHQPNGPDTVTNQVWAALALNGVGFPTYVYRQDKQRAAQFEARLLHDIGKSLKPSASWPQSQPPVVAHGPVRLGLLVCSELTNIAYRAHFRGQVDVLFVPEWNQDLTTFSTLVESAALDVHAYIAQANIRGLGDSRIRAPGKNDWERDIVRLRGGDRDYIVAGEIDIERLRRFQAMEFDPTQPVPCCHPADPFKPTPDGFKLAPARSPSDTPPTTSTLDCHCSDDCPCAAT